MDYIPWTPSLGHQHLVFTTVVGDRVTQFRSTTMSPTSLHRTIAILLISTLVISASMANEYEGYEFEIGEGNTITITGYSGPGGDLIIPSVINGIPVTRIARSAFREYALDDPDRMITSVRFPEGLTSVGRLAFHRNPMIREVYIPASLTDITRPAFGRNPSLMNFHIHEDNPEFRSVDGVWYTRDMKELRHFPQGRGGSYTIPDGVEHIRDEAFRFNREIEAIHIPNSVTLIGKQAFRECVKLTELVLPENLESLVVQGRHFLGCTGLTRIVLPDSLTILPRWSFQNCTNLREVILPKNLTQIGEGAFLNCTSLERIVIPASFRAFRGNETFAGCANLREIIFLGDAPEVIGRDHFPPNVTIYHTANANGWSGSGKLEEALDAFVDLLEGNATELPDPDGLWNGRPTALYEP